MPVVLSLSAIGREAAALACVCKAAAAAAPTSKWRSVVRVGRGGAVFEPAAGTFDVTVAPGEDVQAAVDRCPPGGCVLLLPGTHAGPLVLEADQEVHVFGRGRATLQTSTGDVFTSEAAKGTADGLVLRREAGGSGYEYGVLIKGGALRLQACDLAFACSFSMRIEGGSDPMITSCRYVRNRASRGACLEADVPLVNGDGVNSVRLCSQPRWGGGRASPRSLAA